MAQNTATIIRGKVTIKHHPLRRPKESEIQKLIASLGLAQAAVWNTVRWLQLKLSPYETKLLNDMLGLQEYGFETFVYHFGLPNGIVQETTWRLYLSKLHLKYLQIHKGLIEPISIADEFSTMYAKGMEVVKENIHPDTSDEEILDMMEQAATVAADTAAGAVYRKKSFERKLTPDQLQDLKNNRMVPDGSRPKVWVGPEDQGSIHINFHTLLRDSRFSELHVASAIIHEASHKFCGTVDHSYAYEADKYTRLSMNEKAWNADSYALCAISIHQRKLIKRDIE